MENTIAKQPDLWSTFDEQLSAVPGGTSLHPAVLRNMQRPYVNPWSEEFLAYYDETLALLKRLYNTTNDVLVMIGPIRIAMDAVVCSLLGPGEKAAFVSVNGYWSELFTHIARAHGTDPVILEEPWGQPIDPEKVRKRLAEQQDQNIKALFVTHVETSTGVANPVQELGRVAEEQGLLYVVDAGQTLGGSEVLTDDWGVDFCISGNHKCMSSPAGLSYVSVSQRGWQALEQRTTPIQGWYSNLLVWRDVWLGRQSGYFTFPTSLVFGLRAALDQMFSITLPELYRRYAVVSKAIRLSVSEMGLELVVCGRNCPGCDSPGRFCADTVTAIKRPPDISHTDFAGLMHQKYGISIAGTYGPLADKAFRVGPTGLLQLSPRYILNLLCCMGMALRELGFPGRVEEALSVANAQFDETGQLNRSQIVPACGRGSGPTRKEESA